MPRRELAITDTYQKASARPVTITIKRMGKGVLYINNTDVDDVAADAFSRGSTGQQIVQMAFRDTYIRATGINWEVYLDD